MATTVPLGLVSTHDSYLWLPFCNEIQLLDSIEYFWFWYLYIYYILALPEEDPIIAGVEPQYLIGEQINLNCTSGKSYPASILHWYINEQQVSFYGLWSCFNDDMFFIKKPDARKMKRVLNENKKIENRICSYLNYTGRRHEDVSNLMRDFQVVFSADFMEYYILNEFHH